VVAAGTVPLVDQSGDAISAGARYERMQHEYQLLVSEQHICGAQVHVDVPDRDVAVQVTQRVAPYLPALLAISASSPYWRGRDSGYASFRSMVWSRWPTAGPPGHLETGADYDRMVADLIASGTISDPGMVYFDIRPSAHLPTVELRVCDACPHVDDVVLIAGLFRALVGRARADLDAGRPLPEARHELLRAASWRAARSGLEGDLVDLVGPSLTAPDLLIGALVKHLRPQLEQTGDWEQVLELSRETLGRGSAAAAQRRVYGRRGEFVDVVDALLARTQGRVPTFEPPSVAPTAPELLAAYHPSSFDEAVSAGGTVLPHYGWMFRALERMGPRGLVAAESALRTEQRARGVTFRVGDGEPDRLFPLDLVPRIVTGEDWAGLTAGLTQRVRALEAFVRDVYGDRSIVADGVVPPQVVADAPGLSRVGRLVPEDAVRIAVAGIDLVRDRADHWLVLEDNLRVPSGIGYSVMSRRLIRSVMPDLEPPAGVVGLEAVPGRLHAALLSATELDEPGFDEVALLSAGEADSAYFEHRLLADRMGVPLVTPRQLQVSDEGGLPDGHRGAAAALGALPSDRRERADVGQGGRPAPDRPGAGQRGVPGRGGDAQRAGQRGRRRQAGLRLRAADDRLLPGRAGAAGQRADLPVRRPRAAHRGARPPRRAGAQAGRRIRRAGHRDRPARPSAPSWPRWPSSSGATLRGGSRRTWSSCPLTRRSPRASWSRARSTCGRSCCSRAAAACRTPRSCRPR
jgi:carboxylate-amine ligase